MASKEAQSFIDHERAKIRDAEKQIKFLESIDFPVFCRGHTNDGRNYPLLATEDYSAANRVQIASKTKYDIPPSQSGPDGGYRTVNNIFYPDFSVAVSRTIIPVIPNFSFTNEEQEIDPKIIFLDERVVQTSGEMYKKYQESPVITYPNSIEDICNYLTEQGLSSSLVKRFKNKARQTKGLIARNRA